MNDPHELIIGYYDDVYPHDSFRNDVSSIREELLRRFEDVFSIGKVRVLDLCTGTGRALSLFCGDTRFDLAGVDISDKMLGKARQNYPEVSFIKGDIRDLSHAAFKKGYFHCIQMTSVSIQLFNQSDRKQIFKQVEELLVQGGVFIFDVFSEPLEYDAQEKNAFIKRTLMKNDLHVLIIYHRLPFRPPAPSKQYVYLIETRAGSEPTMSSGVVDIYNVTLDDVVRELEGLGLLAQLLPTNKKNTKFVLIEKGLKK